MRTALLMPRRLKMSRILTYSELIQIDSFEERFKYLSMPAIIGSETFGSDRYLNQLLYRSSEWRRLRDRIIIRDGACDLGVPGYELNSGVIVHHIMPITPEDVINRAHKVFSVDNLITASSRTHRAIHFGDITMIPKGPTVRTKGDTKLW